MQPGSAAGMGAAPSEGFPVFFWILAAVAAWLVFRKR
jgi:hypothetical protein